MILDNDGKELLSKSCGTNDEDEYYYEYEYYGETYEYFYGAELPDTITFTSQATLVFYSDRYGTEPGFSATLSEEVSVVITQFNTNPDSRSVKSGNTTRPETREGRFLVRGNISHNILYEMLRMQCRQIDQLGQSW